MNEEVAREKRVSARHAWSETNRRWAASSEAERLEYEDRARDQQTLRRAEAMLHLADDDAAGLGEVQLALRDDDHEGASAVAELGLSMEVAHAGFVHSGIVQRMPSVTKCLSTSCFDGTTTLAEFERSAADASLGEHALAKHWVENLLKEKSIFARNEKWKAMTA